MVLPDFVRSTIQSNPTQKDLRMTNSAVQPETVTREFSFALPTEDQTNPPHGVFFRNGEQVSSPYFSSTLAFSDLDEFVASGQIPSEHRPAIAEEIRASGLPKNNPYLGPFRFVVETTGSAPVGFFLNASDICIGTIHKILFKKGAREILKATINNGTVRPEEEAGLLEAINNSELPENERQALEQSLVEMFKAMGTPEYDGPYTFKIRHNNGVMEGYVINKDNRPVPGVFRSKAHAIYEIENGAKKGMFNDSDLIRLLGQIGASSLPTDWNMTVVFKLCTNCPAFVPPHGHIFIDDKPVGDAQSSVAGVNRFLVKLVKIGAKSEADVEEIRNDMRKAGLPESDPRD